jgi:hypothetical protein
MGAQGVLSAWRFCWVMEDSQETIYEFSASLPDGRTALQAAEKVRTKSEFGKGRIGRG